MAMKLEKVVPFGRSLDEYRHMFRLTEADLTGRILGVADGPASFNAELAATGRRAVSVDPLYVFGAAEIERQFHRVVDDIIAQVRATPQDWVWSYHGSPDGLRANRVAVLERFLTDYEDGRAEGRYVAGTLPRLPFADAAFDLALCSHFLFLYSEHFDYGFHRDAIRELLRLAREVRIFPLLTLMRELSPHLDPLIGELRREGYGVSVEKVDYELQRGGNEMLRIRRRADHCQ
jgi:hypothetical protein